MFGTIDLQQLNVPIRLISTTFFHISMSYSHNVAVGPVIPALFIKMSMFEFFVISFTVLSTPHNWIHPQHGNLN